MSQRTCAAALADRRPIVILGAARSGTTMLGDLLDRLPGVAYWVEPKYIWRYGAAGRPHDVRGAEDATPDVRDYIRCRFERFTERADGGRFMEKTPSNCFRVPFIHAVMPEATIVHLMRDGRDVTLSAIEKWTSPPDGHAITRRLRSFEIPLRDLPSYGLATVRDVVGRQVLPDRGFVWGPQFPGIHEVRKEDGPLAACAWQWRRSVEAAAEGLSGVPSDRVVDLRYEDFVASPRSEITRLLDALGIEPPPGYVDAVDAEVSAGSVGRWREQADRLEPILPILAPALNAMGYPTGTD